MIRIILLLLICLFTGLNHGIAQGSASGFSHAAVKAGPVYMGIIRDAAESFRKRDFAAAEAKLDEADKIKPDLADSLNLRGAILVEKKEFDKARQMFAQALKLQPNAIVPKFNIAEILLMQKKFTEARAEFRKFDSEGGYRELVDFKVMITYLGEGKDDRAKDTLEHIKFPGDTGAYYFANAAWEFAHGNADKAKEWIQSANVIFNPGRTYVFYDTLADMGWVDPRKADSGQALMSNPDEDRH